MDKTTAIELTPEQLFKRRLVACICLLLGTVVLLSVLSYDWHDIKLLSKPANNPIVNYIGPLGAWITFMGYSLFGIAFTLSPFFIYALAILQLYPHIKRFTRRLVWLGLIFISISCLFQAHRTFFGFPDNYTSQTTAFPKPVQILPEFSSLKKTVFTDFAESLNISPNAGGAIGQWIVTDFLVRNIKYGTFLLLWPLFLLFIILFVGFRNTALALAWLASIFHLIKPSQKITADVKTDSAKAILADARRSELNSDSTVSLPRKPSLWNRITSLFSQSEDDLTEPATEAPVLNEFLEAQKEANKRAKKIPVPISVSKPIMPAAPLKLSPNGIQILQSADQQKTVATPKHERNVIAVQTEKIKKIDENSEASDDVEIHEDYILPGSDLLNPIPNDDSSAGDVQESAADIVSVLNQFGIEVEVTGIISGPVVTQYEIRPAIGVKVEKIVSYTKNLKMALRTASLRIQAPIPGKDVVGIEVPNRVPRAVTFRELVEGATWSKAVQKCKLPLALGKTATGDDLIIDLVDAPHLLVAGATGQGKSVGINAMLCGLLMCRKPEQLRLILVDPKCVEFTPFESLPHLLIPVVTNAQRVMFALRWAVFEMNRRYKLFQKYEVRNIADYNSLCATQADLTDELDLETEPAPKSIPYIVIVVDELADLMLTVKSDIEPAITSITQKARAAGLHMIIATQRPTTDIITGTIKANIPARISFKVAQGNDSRAILDEMGAETLIGRGDMLLARAGKATERSQGAFVQDEEIKRLTGFIKNQAPANYDSAFTAKISSIKDSENSNPLDESAEHDNGDGIAAAGGASYSNPNGADDPNDKSDEAYYKRAIEMLRQTKRFSTSALQRRCSIGYVKAGRITEMLEERGIIGPPNASKAREILVDLETYFADEYAGTDGENKNDDNSENTIDLDESSDNMNDDDPFGFDEPLDNNPYKE